MRAVLAAAIAGAAALGAQAAATQPMALRTATELTPVDTATHTTSHAVHISGKKSLKAQAKISDDSALAIARAQMPGAGVTWRRITRENKKLVYEINLKQPGAKGGERVWIDATTGSVVKTKQLSGSSGHAHQAKTANDSTKSTP